MKKIYTLITSLLVTGTLFAQSTAVLQEDFNSYIGDDATKPAGWMFTNISSTATNNFYSTAPSSGPSGPNSFKFYAANNTMGPTIITPRFGDLFAVDSLSFWMKGNSTTAGSTFAIVAMDDTTAPTVIDTIDFITTIPTTGTIKAYSMPSGVHYVAFSYYKAAGNVAFDDVKITVNGPTAINKKVSTKTISVYPNPSNNGVFMIDGLANESSIMVYNAIGELVWNKTNVTDNKVRVDLTSLPQGVYIARVKGSGVSTTTYKLIKN